MHKVSAITAKGLERRKKDLENRLHELVGPSHTLELLQVESLADPLDQVVSNTEREIVGQQLDSEAHLIKDIRSAVDKIENGVYGECEGCQEPIGLRRLDAVPWARLCVACQSAIEARRNEHSFALDHAA